MKKIIVFSILFSIIKLNSLIYAEECGTVIDCPKGINYPYTFCNSSTGELEYHCAENPYKFLEENPHLKVRKIQLPITIGEGNYNFEHFRYYTHYNGVRIFDYVQSTAIELNQACYQWNCICGYEDVDAYPEKSAINFVFTDNAKDFEKKCYNPKTTIAVSHEVTNTVYCELILSETKIYFNCTSDFMFGTKEFPPIGTPIKTGFANEIFVENGNINSIPKAVTIYSFIDIAMHELGHMLGFGDYYTENLSGKYTPACDNGEDKELLYGAMHGFEIDVCDKIHRGLSQYDKCMFAKLYCDDLTSISEYKPINTNIYPNPGRNVVKIEFELENYCKNVTVSIIDGLGRLLLTPIENKQYEIGNHSELINVDSFETGYYYLVIQTETKKSLKPFVVIK